MDILKAEIARKRKLIEDKDLIDVSIDCSRTFYSSTLYTAVFLMQLCTDMWVCVMMYSCCFSRTQRNTSKGLISRERKRKNIIRDVDTRYKLEL